MAKTATAAVKTTKTAAAKATPAVAREPRAPKEGLRKPQIRLLALLAKTGAPINAATLSEKAPVDRVWVPEFCGKLDAEKRAAADEKYNLKSLVTRGYAKVFTRDNDGKTETVWQITATGKKALIAEQKAAAAK